MRTRFSPARCCGCGEPQTIQCNVDAMAWPKKNLRIDVQQVTGTAPNLSYHDRLVDLEFVYKADPDTPPAAPFARRWWYAEGQYLPPFGGGQTWRFHMGCGDRAGLKNTPILLVQIGGSGAGPFFPCGSPHVGFGGLVTVSLVESPFYWAIEYRSGCKGLTVGDPWGGQFDIQISEP